MRERKREREGEGGEGGREGGREGGGGGRERGREGGRDGERERERVEQMLVSMNVKAAKEECIYSEYLQDSDGVYCKVVLWLLYFPVLLFHKTVKKYTPEYYHDC